ncbi:hypothetical protein ACFX2I_003729 [Malus domestica]
MRFEDLSRTGCKNLFGSISVQSDGESPFSLEFETVELGWWVGEPVGEKYEFLELVAVAEIWWDRAGERIGGDVDSQELPAES